MKNNNCNSLKIKLRIQMQYICNTFAIQNDTNKIKRKENKIIYHTHNNNTRKINLIKVFSITSNC